jgi:hypothetical protein
MVERQNDAKTGLTLRLRLGALVAALMLGWAAPAFAHEGHNHEAEVPPAALQDLKPRAVATGATFQLVGIPVSGSLAIFIDSVASNAPVVGAFVELMTAGDATLVAEEVVPGLYMASPWPPQGVRPEQLIGSEIITTIVADSGDDLLLVRLPDRVANPDGVADATNETGVGEHVASMVSKDAEEWGGSALLILAGSILSLAGAFAGLRNHGTGRWIGFGAVAMGAMIGVTSLGIV